MLNIYNNRCLRCNYNPFSRSKPVDRTPERAKELHAECSAAARKDKATTSKTEAMNTVATLCQREGMHFFGQGQHASLSLPHPNIFRAVSGIGHMVELGVLLRLVQAIACEIHRLGDPIYTSVNARLRAIRAQRPFFGGVRAPSAANITSLFSRRSPMSATELISVAPLLLVAIKDVPALKDFASDLKEGLYVLSFCYATEPHESELSVWQTELDKLQTGVLSGARVTTTPKWEKKKKKGIKGTKKKVNDRVADATQDKSDAEVADEAADGNGAAEDEVDHEAGDIDEKEGTSCISSKTTFELTILGSDAWQCNQEPHHRPLTRHDARHGQLHCCL